VKLVDVVPPFSWAFRALLREHEHIHDLVIRDKTEQLEVLAAPLRNQGIDVQTEVLHGKTASAIIQEVVRNQHDLVMRIAKGPDSRSEGFFGTTGTRLLRECPCAVNLVAADATTGPKRVLACVDAATGDSTMAELNCRVFEVAHLISIRHAARLSVVNAWTVDAEQWLHGRLQPDDREQLKADRQAEVASLLTAFLQANGSELQKEDIYLLKGNAFDVIPEFADRHSVDLVVLGTVGRSGLSGLMIGNTAEHILESIKCSVLAVKPDSFASPVTRYEDGKVAAEQGVTSQLRMNQVPANGPLQAMVGSCAARFGLRECPDAQ